MGEDGPHYMHSTPCAHQEEYLVRCSGPEARELQGSPRLLRPDLTVTLYSVEYRNSTDVQVKMRAMGCME